MRGLSPRPVSILFLVVMTVLLEQHVAYGCFCCSDLRKSPDSCEEEPTWGKEEQEGDEPRM